MRLLGLSDTRLRGCGDLRPRGPRSSRSGSWRDDLCPIKIADLLFLFLFQVMTKTSGTLKLVATMVAERLLLPETAMWTTVMDNQWALRDLDIANAFTLSL